MEEISFANCKVGRSARLRGGRRARRQFASNGGWGDPPEVWDRRDPRTITPFAGDVALQKGKADYLFVRRRDYELEINGPFGSGSKAAA
jgi:hypothetical protein